MIPRSLIAVVVCLLLLFPASTPFAGEYHQLLDDGTRDLLHEALSGEIAKDHVAQISLYHRIQGSRGYRKSAHYVLNQLHGYGFSEKDLIYGDGGNLLEEKDPKLAWAEKHLKHNPVEINMADRETLLRVPGIGPKGVRAILQLRSEKTIRDMSSLKKAGIHSERARDYILLSGRKPIHQSSLFQI